MKKILGVLIFTFMTLLCIPNVNVKANEQVKIAVQITTDKEEYKVNEEIKYSINIKNTLGYENKELVINCKIPKEFKILNSDVKLDNTNSLKWYIDSIKPGEEKTLDFSVKVEKSNGNDDVIVDVDKNDNLPNTGGNMNVVFTGLISLMIGLALFLVKGKKVKKNVTSLFLVITLTVTLMGYGDSVVNAKTMNIKENLYKTIKVNNEDYTINVEVVGKCEDNEEKFRVTASRIFENVSITWNEIENALYTVKKGTSLENLEVVAENINGNLYLDKLETADTIAYYQVLAYVNDAETNKSEVVKIEAVNDSDSDLLTDEDEQNYGTNPNNLDTDLDGLSDYEEVIVYNTNPLVTDTDLDGLSDYEEVYLTATDPSKKDTDNNGVSDSDEDSDNDGLINKEEIFYGTDPIEYDTDLDGISDSDEIFLHKTNPVAIDSDNDKLSDGDEILQGTDPNNSDTNGNSILDGDEIIEKGLEVKDEEVDKNVTPSLNINVSAGDASDLELLNLENDNYLIDFELPGYMGAAFKLISPENIEGTLTFKYENYSEVPIQYTSITEEVRNEPAIYKFNTQTGALEYMENQSWNKDDKTVITVITEPGIYILVDKYWFEKTWEKEYLSPEYEGKTGDIDIVFSIDDSGSMDRNDSSNRRLDVTKNFIDQLRERDRAGIVGFSSNANNFQSLTSDKELLKIAVDKCGYSSGGTNLTSAINTSFDEISLNSIVSNNRYVVLLTDGEDSGFNRQIPMLLEKAKELGIRIYTIGLGNSVNINDLKWIAEGTDGMYMNADNADELYEIFKEIGDIIDLNADSDSDGIPDYFEMNGIRLASGKILYTDPFKSDSDGDKLSDGQEVGNSYNDSTGIYSIIGSNYDRIDGYWTIVSDPTKADTDNDGIQDPTDNTPIVANDVCDRDLSIAAQLSYTNLEGVDNNKLIDELQFINIASEIKSEMNGWKVIDSIKSNTADWPIVSDDAGLGALALKKKINGKDRVIIAYRGSELTLGTDFINDMLLNNISGFIAGVEPQVKYAVNFYKKVVSENKNADIYVTGHSLGGFLAQKVGYTIIDDNSLIDIFKWNTKEPTKAATFNAYGPLNNLCNVSSVIFDPIITYKMSKMYTHYYNKRDLVGDYLGAGYRFGIGNDINTTHYLGVTESEHYDACQQGGPYFVLVLGKLHSVNHFWEYKNTLTRN